MNTMGRMLFEVVHQRIAGGIDWEVLGVLRLELGLYDTDLQSPDGQKSAAILRRMFRASWKRLGEEMTAQLLGAGRPFLRPPRFADEPSDRA